MRRMSAGHGYRYLLNSVAQADAGRAGPMAYYSSPGTPPGRWVGSGVAALAGGELAVGDRVSEEQLGLP
ncbi:relaxase domain-containing protein, partial [Euzebya pacifica]|uniref:relaxase domain-containing protein n=1 Tax=Euzebya pacifica TaxID=1608957 RepID=UPI003C6DB380